jgi:hypothetical protein
MDEHHWNFYALTGHVSGDRTARALLNIDQVLRHMKCLLFEGL